MINLSIIIPAHNEADRIQLALDQLIGFLGPASEILIVENGSTDQTAALVDQYIQARGRCPWPDLRLIQLAQGDKGQAVAAGMMAAAGRWRYMADADLATPIDEVDKFIRTMISTRADIVIGNRAAPQDQTAARRLMSQGFKALACWALAKSYEDTQAGFKLFSARAAELIFPRLKVHGWAFDVEVLLIARQHRMRVVELPIRWQHQPGSKLNLMDPARMLLDVARIKIAHYETGG